MKQDIKHYLKVGGILCAIGGISALLIGLTNLVTHTSIEKYEKQKEENGLKAVFIDENGNLPTDLVAGEKVEIKDSSFNKLLSYWNPKSNTEQEGVDEKYGYVFKCEGSDKNNYGSITMLVAISSKDYEIGKISIVKNTESYATTVQKDYVDKYNSGLKDLEDVKCGATYGATVIKEMAQSAQKYAKEVLNNGK